ncbi:hypothetical protein B0T20DRAFT_487356 [Sordaria brevicollis]|uniref:Uncharacterized protein n=1 Tax=Sordaria brevicollis TaxID=83679 RepID=A0AAE0P9I0_SORBR|nr:hypothetical protein B0T20DRAFT_487356 [Sordaria brevicollis]
MTILTKAGTAALRHPAAVTIKIPRSVVVGIPAASIGIARHKSTTTTTHVPFPTSITSPSQIPRHIYEQEGLTPEDLTLSYAVSPADASFRSNPPVPFTPHTSSALNNGGLLWSHWHPGPSAGVEYQTRQFSIRAGGLKRAAAVSDPSVWEWGDRSHTQPDHIVAARPIMPGDEHYDPVTINDMPSTSEANVKADRSDIDPLRGVSGPLYSHRHHHQYHHTQTQQTTTTWQSRHFTTATLGGEKAAAIHDPSVYDWGDFSHTQPDHPIAPRPIMPGDPHYDPVTINDMPSQSEANVKADRSEIDPLPMGMHKVIPLPAGSAMPEPTESEWDVRADRASMEEDPLRDTRKFRDYGPLMAAGRKTEKEIKRDMYDMRERGDSESVHSGYGYYGASSSSSSSTSDFSGGEMMDMGGRGMESSHRERSIREDRLFMEDWGEEDESLGTTSFGEGEGREGYEGEHGYFGEEGPALRRRYGMEDVVGMDKSAEEMELEDAMLPHFTRFY